MKNLKIITILVLFAIMTLAVSCGGGSSIDAALSQMEKAMDRVEKNKSSMTEADWRALDAELEQPATILKDAMESSGVGAIAKVKITAAMLRYAAVLGEAALYTVADSLNIKMEDMHLGDSLSSINNQLQDAMNSDEMKKAMDELQKTLNSDELKGAMQELQKATKELENAIK